MHLGRNALLNLLGLGVPLLVALFTIPVLVRELGPAQFGLLTLIWALVGTFGLLDFGLGRALTLQLARADASGTQEHVGTLIASAIALLLTLGVLACVALAASAPWTVQQVRGVTDVEAAARSLVILALALPAVVLTSGLRGILEARHFFADVNLVRLPLGVFTFVGPLLVVWLAGPQLDWIAAVLCLGRWIGFVAHLPLVHRRLAPGERSGAPQRQWLTRLLTTGGWLTASNVVSQLMGYVDRFALAALASAAAVAYYATPLEIVSKLWIIPGAMTAVLFPAFAGVARQSGLAALQMFRTTTPGLLVVMLPLTSGLALFAHELLSAWLDPVFAESSARWLQVFALGMMVNALAHVPYTLIQSAGHARRTAFIHLFELPVFALALWMLIPTYGIGGAAAAWFMRMVLDTVLMMATCLYTLGWNARDALGGHTLTLLGLTAAAFSGALLASPAARGAWFVATLLICAAFAHKLWSRRSHTE
jgi:O-antigen/teichoic acid export membrane protein